MKEKLISALVILLTTACTESRVGYSEQIVLEGEVLNQEDQPLQGAEVVLYRVITTSGAPL